jgi:hypothetical protein
MNWRFEVLIWVGMGLALGWLTLGTPSTAGM